MNEAQVKETHTLEDTLNQVSEIITQLEDKEITLEDSFSLYERGIKKIKECNDEIDKVEKKMLVLNAQGELEEY
ncbi:MAG: exodeoxyribonuclease VII small subunit [Lachnospiraceae bacterium]